MPDQEQKLHGQPHSQSWFTNLLGLYGRTQRPIASYFDELEADEQAFDRLTSDAYERLFTLGATRRRKYEIFEEMDTYSLVSGILDVYSEESTQRDYDRGVSVWIESKSSAMVEAGKSALTNCQVEDRIPAFARSLCKLGDRFQRLLYATGKGVLGWRYANAVDVTRREDKYSRLIGFQEDGKMFRGGKRDVSWPWDYVHGRLLGKDEQSGYGTSMLEGIFRSWRRMTLTEEAILMFRLRRVPDRNLVMVNVGNMEMSEAMRWVNQWKKRFRKYEIVDPASPNYKKQYNPLTPLEDVFLPMIDGRESRVETLAGSGNIGEIYDLEFFRDEFFGGAKVPKAYFGFEGDINAKATLMQQDVRFARGLKRIQRALIYALRQLLDIHYTLLMSGGKFDFRTAEYAYLVQMSPISYLDEFERLELMQLRYQIVEAMSRLAQDMQLDPRVWATYVLLNYAKLPEDLVLKLIRKTPDETASATGGGPGFESLPDDKKRAILDEDGEQRKGFTILSEAEQLAIAKCVHDSPALRRSISNWAEYGSECADAYSEMSLLERSSLQTDPSILPVTSCGSIEDDVSEDRELIALKEDIAGLEKL